MSASLLRPPAHLPPSTALQLSQQAPSLLRSTPSSITPSLFLSPLSLLSSTSESTDLWISHENLFLSCLRTLDNDAARACLERLAARFGEENERVMALRGVWDEAVAEDEAGLEKILKGYEAVLRKDPANMPIAKRRIALLKSMKKNAEAITALTTFLESSPTDAEAWAELSDLYIAQGMYPQGVYALEEVLLVTPYAWNIHARLGEVLYMLSKTDESGTQANRCLADSMRRFCRSIELCDDYLRGYYGLKIVTSRLLETLPLKSNNHSKENRVSKNDKNNSDEENLSLPDISLVERLNESATAKLSEIVRRNTSGEEGWQGYEEAEVISARELLDRDVRKVER